MPVSPSCVSGVSAYHFRTCRSLVELWIFQVGQGTFKYWLAEGSETTKTPKMMQACSFFLNSFSEFCFSTSAFSSTIILHKIIQVFDTLKIPVHCFGTWNTLKKVICLIVLQALFLLLCHFHINLNMQNWWPPWSSTYYWQFSTGNHLHVKWSRLYIMPWCACKVMGHRFAST